MVRWTGLKCVSSTGCVLGKVLSSLKKHWGHLTTGHVSQITLTLSGYYPFLGKMKLGFRGSAPGSAGNMTSGAIEKHQLRLRARRSHRPATFHLTRIELTGRGQLALSKEYNQPFVLQEYGQYVGH